MTRSKDGRTYQATEHSTTNSPPIGRILFVGAFGGGLPQQRALAGAVALVLIGIGSTRAQQPASTPNQAGVFTASWSEVETAVEQIELVLRKSRRVQFSKPVKRAYVTSETRASVEVISPVELLLTGQEAGNTQLVVWAEDDSQLIFDLNIQIELERLRRAIAKAAPQSEVKADSILGTIILSGTVSNADDARQIVEIANLFGENEVQNHMTVTGEQQVLLRVTIAEMSRQATRQLGINGFMAGDNFKDVFVLNNLGGINPSNIGAAGGSLANSTIPFLVGEGGIPTGDVPTLSLGFPRLQMQLFLQALRDNGLARILAEPTLVTVSGQSAEFLAGGEFPIPVPQGGAGGSTSITIDYREFGVQLRFQPTVLAGDRIRMVVNPIVSELDFTNAVNLTGFIVPGLIERSAETTVEVGNGQTIVIAGLFNDQIRANASRIPGLGDIPILGALFRSVRYQRSITELVIMVTPEIVAPMNPNQVPTIPGSDISSPNDWELYGLGVLEAGQDPLASGLYGPQSAAPEGVMEPAVSDEPQGGHAGPQGRADTPAVGGTQTSALTLFGPWGPANGGEETSGTSPGR